MPKPTLRGRKPANRELQPELYLDRPKGRGFRPSYDEMREALIATRGRYGLASIRLQCAERSLRDWVRQDSSLAELVEELRTLRIDKSEARIDQIADDPEHLRSFDANRLTGRRELTNVFRDSDQLRYLVRTTKSVPRPVSGPNP